MTIQEVLSMKEKLPVVDLHARFVRAHEKKTGTSDYGEWSIQNFEIEDDTGTITVMAHNRPEDFSQLGWEGKEILISAVKTKNGWNGAFTINDTYNNTTIRKIKLNKFGVCQLATTNQEHPTQEPPKPQKLDISQAAEIMEFCHRLAQSLYPDAPDAAATVGNTLFIAIANGRVSTRENQ